MGQQQSKDELVFQQVSYGNIEGIKSLVRDGAGLEWMDRDGKTALIQASMNAEHYQVAKTLIELGANVNAYRPGRNAGTPLHHAAKRGLDQMVKLLLLNGANALAINDDCQTPLEVARAKGFTNVVRTIENYICLFSGWMREFHGPGFLEVIAQLVYRKVWVVVLPVGSRNLSAPFKLEMAIYSSSQDAQPRTLIQLWKSNLLDSKSGQPDPSVTIAINSKTRVRLAPANEGDKEQLQWFSDACKGIPRATHPPPFLQIPVPLVGEASAPPLADDLELAMAISASLQLEHLTSHPPNEANSSNGGNLDNPSTDPTNGWGVDLDKDKPTSKLESNGWGVDLPSSSQNSSDPTTDTRVEMGPIQYPTIESSSLSLSSPSAPPSSSSSSCVICLDAPVEAACIPCGHMAGCLLCLNGIKAKNWGCPVCRAEIDQVVKLYAV